MVLKETSNHQTSAQNPRGGFVEVAVWKDAPQGLETYDAFFNFEKPLQILSTPVWHPQIKTSSNDGFFVFSEKIPHV